MDDMFLIGGLDRKTAIVIDQIRGTRTRAFANADMLLAILLFHSTHTEDNREAAKYMDAYTDFITKYRHHAHRFD